jgi:NAD(P)-dependent dehydrogenase (short-subunit alcohol dehydrogenase family)/rhamnose utilization protein RhaD (predicted bifunctional aldolase and dehydrogenase)
MGDFEELIAVANEYGSNADWVRAGGGNASVKADGVLHIKPSGVPLATLAKEDLVPLRLEVLLEALHSDAPVDGDPVRVAAERAKIGNPPRRPSVEILFHALIPDTLVIHTHPLAANALTCNADAVALAQQLLGDEAVYVPYTNPGVPLARKVEACRQEFESRTGKPAPGITLLGNHGVIISGNSAAEIRARASLLEGSIKAAIQAGAETAKPSLPEAQQVTEIAPYLRALLAGDAGLAVVTSNTSDYVRELTLTSGGQALLYQGPLIPDQIVYAGSFPLVLDPAKLTGIPAAFDAAAEQPLVDYLKATLDAYVADHGFPPIIVAVPGQGLFGVGADLAAASNALATFIDGLETARDAERIGKVRVMDAEQRDFIENWESEAYRKSVAAKAHVGRLAGKVVVVTGAAQGFGLGIATELLATGAAVVLADMNLELAKQNADKLAAEYGAGRAVAVGVNVTDEQSVRACIAEVVALYGGLDIFISNAGVLRAGSVFSQPVADFDFVTSVNYRGYLLGVQASAPVLARQHLARPQAWFDIIEINSKSGLEGSKRNYAYAGSKFGGIGLTQSFALELVENGIKVNAICPGNYLDGPLWSDPERGLFVQYLNTGKVPGAQTIDDVRAYYEAKVPIGRGCLPKDLAIAVCYIVEQQYETGQALPVTGGQNMLN